MAEIVSFGQWVKRRRQQLDLTQKALAQRAGCALGTIRKIEADERRPSRQLATLLARHLELRSDQVETFIALARAEPHSSDARLHFLALADDKTPVIPGRRPALPLPDHPTIRSNLPAETTSFLGREDELATLTELLNSPGGRLVTLVGPGGMGKTRMALAYAGWQISGTGVGELPTQFPDGIFFVDLAPLREGEQVLGKVIEVLDLRIGGERPPAQQLLDYLTGKQLLLLVDNVEHLLAPASSQPSTAAISLLAEILERAPGVRILATSRERLNLSMEQVFPLEGLAYPDEKTAASVPDLKDVAGYAAVQLFSQSARRNRPGFSLESREDIAALVGICRLVVGMPLALELAASWVDKLSLEDIAAELARGLEILETELRDVPDRQRSVRATFDYSWQKLDEKEQSIFAQLSVFRGGFTRAAAQAVTGATLRQISRLVNKSFIQFERQRDRYQVHELLRQYGTDKLGQDTSLEKNVHDRHSNYYCHWLAEHTNDLKGTLQAQALSAIEADIENFQLAWNRASNRQDLNAIGKSQEGLYLYFWKKGLYLQWVDTLGKAAAALKDDQIVDNLSTGDQVARQRNNIVGQLLARLALGYVLLGRNKTAEALCEESLDLLRRAGARQELARPLEDLAGIYEYQGRIEESKQLLQEALAAVMEAGDLRRIAGVLTNVGGLAGKLGEYQEAEQSFRQSLELHRQVNDPSGIAWSLACMSWISCLCGAYEQAEKYGRESLAKANEADDRHIALFSVDVLARALSALGQFQEAKQLFEQNMANARVMAFSGFAEETLSDLGIVAYRTGDLTQAQQLFHEALTLAGQDELWGVIRSRDGLGRVALAQRACPQARQHFQAALQASISFGQPPHLLASMASIAELFAEEGDLEHAALLASLVANHPASQARIKERAAHLLTQLEADLSSEELVRAHQKSQQRDLKAVAEELVVDMTTTSRPSGDEPPPMVDQS